MEWNHPIQRISQPSIAFSLSNELVKLPIISNHPSFIPCCSFWTKSQCNRSTDSSTDSGTRSIVVFSRAPDAHCLGWIGKWLWLSRKWRKGKLFHNVDILLLRNELQERDWITVNVPLGDEISLSLWAASKLALKSRRHILLVVMSSLIYSRKSRLKSLGYA